MDHATLLSEEIDAGLDLVRAFNKYEPIKVAFWLKASDEDHTYLYLASDGIDDTNFDVAYGEVLRITEQNRSLYLDPFRVKLINASDPLAKEAEEINRKFPGRMATRFGGKTFGGISVDEVYIYPPSLVAVAA